MVALIIGALLALAYFVYYKLTNSYTYWNIRNVKGPKPELYFGNFRSVLAKTDSITSLVRGIYEQYSHEKAVGIYLTLTPVLIVKDPDIIKRIIVKDFNYFTDRGYGLTNETIDKNLFSLDGYEWKILRQKLTPLFSTGKLKYMMPLMNNIVKQYVQYVDKIVDKKEPREARELNIKYTLKIITSVAFGLNIDTFTEDKSQFIEMANKLFGFRRRLPFLIDGIKPGILRCFPFNLITFTPREIYLFFLNLVHTVIKEREGKPKTGKDFMDLMIELKEQGTVTKSRDDDGAELEITDELITAQALLFYAAGFETSSSTMSFMLYELARAQDVQDRCFDEIKHVMEKCEGELTYEALNDLQYVSMAFDETLRKHPVGGLLIRQCVTDYKIPELDITIEKGVRVFLPVIGLHHDPKYFPEPDKFDPERFSPANKGSIHSGTYLPFGDGPRNCIGLRLAKVQSILGLAYFLYNYRVTVSEKTPDKIRYDPTVIVLKSIDGLWLNIERRL